MEAATRGEEHAAWGEELHRPQVDLLVAADRGVERVARLREGGRVEDDRVVVRTRVLLGAEKLERVGLHRLDVRESVSLGVRARARERGARGVERGDGIRVSREVERERAMIREAVERAAARH